MSSDSSGHFTFAGTENSDGDHGYHRNFFIYAGTENLDRNTTNFEDGYHSNIIHVTAGLDFEIAPRWIAGLALETSRQNLDFDRGRGADSNSQGIVGFVSFLPTDNTFAQFYAGYARDSYKRDRIGLFSDLNPDGSLLDPPTASGVQHADYNADQYRAGLLVGYDIVFSNLTVSPFAGLDWKRTKVGTYSETGDSGLELTFYGNNLSSLQSSVGLQGLVALRSGSWVFVPQASISWKHEFENDQQNLQASFVGDMRAQRFTYQTSVPDRDWGEINTGIVVVFPNRIQAVGNYRAIAGNSNYRSQAVTIGIRVPF